MAEDNQQVDVDRDYFESLYRRHYAAIMRFAARRPPHGRAVGPRRHRGDIPGRLAPTRRSTT
jgi:hypothetical protein